MKKRLLSILLCIMLCLSMMPTAVFADWIEDAEQCELCNGWDEGDNICDNCGCHENGICEDWTHCLECGACFADIFGFCTECGICEDCYNTSTEHCILCGEHVGDTCDDCGFCESCIEAWDAHCPECGACLADEETYLCIWHKDHCLNEALICDECGICYFEDPDSYCEDCYLCIECAIAAGKHCGICEECADGEICEMCGMCPDCALENEMHCPECGDCVNGEMCLEGGEHCQNCCVICDSCKLCVEASGLDICSDCGFCEECCAQLSMDEGCDSGEVCVASAEWDEHFCEECGLCFCAADPCEDCVLCLECCAAASMDAGCSTGDVCVESSEWDHHFCDDCGVCFCEVDWCDYCGLCADCCEANSDCGDGMCVEDPDYDDHFCSVCGQCFHDVDQCAACAGNGDIVCLDCCTKAAHSAPVVNKEAPQILRQPKDYVGPASYSSVDIYTTFSVKLKNPNGATYQWQRQINSGKWETLSEMWLFAGVDTDTLKTYVSEDSCDPDMHYRFRCMVTNAYGTTYSDVVELESVHNYSDGCVEYDSEQHGNMCSCGLFTDLEPHKFTAWKVTKEATTTATGLRERSCTGCGYKETEVIPKIHVHTFITTYTSDNYYHWYQCTASGCGEVANKQQHQFGDLVVTTAATQAASGRGYRTCKKCGRKVYEDIPKLPHTHDYLKGTAPKYYTVKDYEDNNSFDSMNHWRICLEKIGSKTCGARYDVRPHAYGGWSKPNADGYMKRSCTTCGYTQEYYATEDEMGKHLISVTAADVLINGKRQGYFAKKGDVITITLKEDEQRAVFDCWTTKAYIMHAGVNTYMDSVPLTEPQRVAKTITFTMPDNDITVKPVNTYCHHTDTSKQHYDESTAVPASCFTVGQEADLICDICHKVVERGAVIPAYGDHDYKLDESTVIEATCTKVGFTGNMVCTHCGDTVRGERVAKLEHAYGETKVITAPTCHSLGLEGKVCSECGYVLRGDRIDRTAHTESDWIIDSVGHMTKCTDPDCGALIKKKTAHTDGNADGKCDVCGYDESKAAAKLHEHKADAFKSDSAAHWKVCTECKETFAKEAHKFGDWKVVKAATGKEEGLQERVCSVCGYKESKAAAKLHEHKADAFKSDSAAHWKVCNECEETFAKEAHKYGDWKVVKAATDKEAGLQERVCSVCGYKEQKKLSLSGLTIPFVDVPEDAYYYDATVWAFNAEPQITDGNGKDKFMPEQICTRGQVVTFLWRAAGQPDPAKTENAATWYTDAYNWARYDANLLEGTFTGTYDINGQCPRKNVVQYLYTYYNMSGE